MNPQRTNQTIVAAPFVGILLRLAMARVGKTIAALMPQNQARMTGVVSVLAAKDGMVTPRG